MSRTTFLPDGYRAAPHGPVPFPCLRCGKTIEKPYLGLSYFNGKYVTQCQYTCPTCGTVIVKRTSFTPELWTAVDRAYRSFNDLDSFDHGFQYDECVDCGRVAQFRGGGTPTEFQCPCREDPRVRPI